MSVTLVKYAEGQAQHPAADFASAISSALVVTMPRPSSNKIIR
jgi:hypothetical protein